MNFYYVHVNNELAIVAKNDEELRNYLNDNNLTIIDSNVEFGRDFINIIAA